MNPEVIVFKNIKTSFNEKWLAARNLPMCDDIGNDRIAYNPRLWAFLHFLSYVVRDQCVINHYQSRNSLWFTRWCHVWMLEHVYNTRHQPYQSNQHRQAAAVKPSCPNWTKSLTCIFECFLPQLRRKVSLLIVVTQTASSSTGFFCART